MTIEEATTIFSQYSALANVLVSDMSALKVTDQTLHRKLSWEFMQIRRAAWTLEKRSMIIGQDRKYRVWANKEINDARITKRIKHDIGWRDDWDLGYLSWNMEYVLRTLKNEIDALGYSYPHIVRTDINPHARLEKKEKAFGRELIIFKDVKDKLNRRAVDVRKLFRSYFLSDADVIILYDLHTLKISVGLTKRLSDSEGYIVRE